LCWKRTISKFNRSKPKNLKYLGFLNQKELIKWYRVEYVFLPVRYAREGFNQVVGRP
jgi:hypothetical protein